MPRRGRASGGGASSGGTEAECSVRVASMTARARLNHQPESARRNNLRRTYDLNTGPASGTWVGSPARDPSFRPPSELSASGSAGACSHRVRAAVGPLRTPGHLRDEVVEQEVVEAVAGQAGAWDAVRPLSLEIDSLRQGA